MQQLHPRAVWLFFLKLSIQSLGGGFFVGFFIFQITLLLGAEGTDDVQLGKFWTSSFISALILFIFFIVISYIWAKLTYRFYRYELKEEGFRKESGVIWKHYVTIPYERIQNVDIYRGLFDRILGLSDLNIQTAGISGYGRLGAMSEGRLPGLNPQTAEQLRDELIHRAKTSKNNQGL